MTMVFYCIAVATLWISATVVGTLGSNSTDDHPCRRQCRSGEASQLCEYTFHVDWYTTMGRTCYYCPSKSEDCSLAACLPGSGSQRPVVVANRKLPGPPIEVCVGDRIRVEVINGMQNGETVSIHWHGMRQLKSPYMDGVPMITQCPINPSSSFTYQFEADVPGTYFWHSHAGLQRADGLAGALIVRTPNDPHYELYDVDDLPALILNDWYPNETAAFRFAIHHFGDADNKPPQILVNGLWQESTTQESQTTPGGPIVMPLPVKVSATEYRISPSLRYRFRTISNTFLLCPISITIDGHNLVIIATDGMPVKPQATRALVIMPGERYDFVPYFTGEIPANSSVFWLRAKGLADCAVKKAQGLARIVYVSGNPTAKSVVEATKGASSSVADEVNSLNYRTAWDKIEAGERGRMNVVLLDSVQDSPEIARTPDVQFVVGMDFENVNDTRFNPAGGLRGNHIYSPRMNHITMRMPPAPLLSQPDDVPSDLFCNSTNRICPADQFCECIHALNVPLNALVELILIDTGVIFSTANHPTHLHGYSFHVVGMDSLHSNLTVDEVIQADKNGTLRRKLKNALAKDTVTIPSGGYVILRFVADNPGAWLLHCHMDYHMEIGMGLVIRVGPHTPPPLPSSSFPRCGNWAAPKSSTTGLLYGTSSFSGSKILLFASVLMLFNALHLF